MRFYEGSARKSFGTMYQNTRGRQRRATRRSRDVRSLVGQR